MRALQRKPNYRLLDASYRARIEYFEWKSQYHYIREQAFYEQYLAIGGDPSRVTPPKPFTRPLPLK